MYRQGLMKNLRHHSLVAWQRADDLFIKVHKLTIRLFPSFERFELGSQLRKAAYSVPANIAEAELVSELEIDLNGVGAPLVGLIRSLQLPDDRPLS